ncbi:flagellar hook-associated protein FlgK [Falsirhodobacter sp. alg1]|uniref:flagellar hook-associated protein FlgK n=1 Tax=Falsirhodobacter sp. alg1 TaxID=1472418 RepID=UPI0005EE157E|nr:flagellar hook-associated protein FlgK [Falsirhodobacter sp. alg1]
MTLSSAFSVARSGLSVSARAADVTSQNVANALTEGYGKRELSLATRSTGGVDIVGITRFADRALTADRRVAEAAQVASGRLAEFYSGIEGDIGVTGDAGALGTLLSSLDTALIDASSQPQSISRLDAVVTAASTLSARVNSLGDQVQAARLKADTRIGRGVADINAALKQLEVLNTAVASQSAQGRDVSSLLDQRQQLVDTVAAQIPVREITRDDGRIALITTSGLTLLDGKAATLGFSPMNLVTPDMTIESRGLSGLTLNGRDVPVAGLGNGAMAADFALRDQEAVAVQQQLDAVGDDLVARLGGSGLITRNANGDLATDPALLAEPWRVRDGMGATTPSAGGNATLLNGLVSALDSGGGAAGTVADFLSSVSTRRIAAEDQADFATARYDTLHTAELGQGVDTDVEMQNLLLIEQSYAANAKVLSAVDQMMQRLLEL